MVPTTATRSTNALVEVLERDGIVRVEGLVSPQGLKAMQVAFDRVLSRLNWNATRGYHKSDKFRRMVEDILTLDPAFQELALHPRVREVLEIYLGPDYALTEVKGWETVASRADFHGWHNDAWYDHKLQELPREVKLGLYLTDVDSGQFAYIKGTHIGNRHAHWNEKQVRPLASRIEEMKGGAGTTFLFDTAGIHRQSTPVLAPRRAVFFNYHDPRTPLQAIDIKAYRYHPLVLNAAFLGDLSAEDRRVLGFGNRSTYQPNHQLEHRYRGLQALFAGIFSLVIEAESRANTAKTAWRYLLRKLNRR